VTIITSSQSDTYVALLLVLLLMLLMLLPFFPDVFCDAIDA
jgi:hypothetical protein